jgi:DNA polymerase-3 subunit alpha
MKKVKEDGQKGIAITDHGNMFGVFQFVKEALKHELKPVAGCEFYMVENRHKKSFAKSRGEKDNRYHQLLLAKNAIGYKNLSTLCSLGYMEGMYSKWPRIDKELLEKYSEGLIGTSCCLGAEIPQAIIQKDTEKAERLVKWWMDLLGDDFYIELQRHRNLENVDGSGMSQEDVNQELLRMAKKFGLKVICTNDAHYLNEEDALPHDILLSLNTGSKLADVDRFRFASSDFYFKTQEEMGQLFADVPAALDYTTEILDKVENLNLVKDVMLPDFPIPKNFKNQNEYLRHLTYEGAKTRYGEITDIHRKRLDYELNVIEKQGFPGYFLIVQDFTAVARDLGVAVGPGRGSAAGSAVAYCNGITNVDPIKYDLLFERFLNPDRNELPDIDIDFDDEGRERVLDYVVDKYGQEKVAQIITYGTMAAKMSIKDVGRVLDIPHNKVNQITKEYPFHPKASLNRLLDGEKLDEELQSDMKEEDVVKAYKIREYAEGKTEISRVLQNAKRLEGSVRNTGVHACAVIISRDPLLDHIPLATAKDSKLFITQFESKVMEDVGMLKMDFLGLKTLSIIKDAIVNIEKRHGVKIDPDTIPLDDQKTFELFQAGDTIGVFQYESPGMQKHMRNLIPEKFEDLIAMNALYRPGPMEYIPDFIKRKHGNQPITYDLPDMKEFLEDTYGITVYQEQVMLLSQKLAGFTGGEADSLRKGMGKKLKKVLDKLHPKFIEGGQKKGHPLEILEKIWKDWEAFASYAFNKSHSTCYALIGFQTAYLKANYPAEYMASVLAHNISNIDRLNFFLRECKKLKLPVLGPDINKSSTSFSVDESNSIRIGLAAIKGVGGAAMELLIKERDKNGEFESIYDLLKRVETGAMNKKYLENLVKAGAMDGFKDIHRATYFHPSARHGTFIDDLLAYGSSVHKNKAESMHSLFGDDTLDMIKIPDIPDVPEWHLHDKLAYEKEVVGIYVSGHPLDKYKFEIENFTNCDLYHFNKVQLEARNLKLAGIITEAKHDINKQGGGYVRFTLQDYNGSVGLRLSKEEYVKYGELIKVGEVVYVEGVFKKYYKSEDLFFNVRQVYLLSTASELLTNYITVNVPLERLDDSFVKELDKLVGEQPGKHGMKIKLVESEDDLQLDFILQKRGIHVNTIFVEKLEKLGLSYKLN